MRDLILRFAVTTAAVIVGYLTGSALADDPQPIVIYCDAASCANAHYEP